MAIDSIRPQIERDSPVRPAHVEPEVVEALRHGNIYEVLRAPGVNRRDIEDYLSGQWRLFQNQIVQDYQVYAGEASVSPPELEAHFAPHNRGMMLDSGDRQFFRQEMAALRAQGLGIGLGVETGDDKQGPGQDVARIAEKAVEEWQNFYGDLQSQMMDAQMVREMKSKTADLNRETQRIVAMVLSGQIDPEYVLIAAAKSNMLQNGTLFSWKGKKIMQLNEEMNRISRDVFSKNPNDPIAYQKEVQMAQSKTRSGSTQMQLEMMDIQKFANNIATTLDWVNNAIRMMAQQRQTPTQAIAAR